MPSPSRPEDFDRFVRRLRSDAADLLMPDVPLTVARAPGRLDMFGGIIDYTGGTVCEMPLARATWAALQPRDDRRLVVRSLDLEAHALRPEASVDLDALVPPAGPRPYQAVREALAADPATAWVRYVAGAWLVLAHEGLVQRFDTGATVVITSDVPLGAGVSSSAALEMAVLTALTARLRLAVQPLRLARLGQMVENLVVGAPCGLMDQLTAVFGRADSLLAIRCQPDHILGQQPLPPGVTVAAIHTGVSHSVGGGEYARARVAAFMAHAILLDHLRRSGQADGDPYGGYLARVSRADYELGYAGLFPESLSGGEFLDRWGGTIDPVTTVRPEVDYPVAAAARHHIVDNARANELLTLLEALGEGRDPYLLRLTGRLLLASHAGYGSIGLGAREADRLVELAEELGPAAGIYGARITGGGCGGSVALLGDERMPERLDELAERYAAETGATPTVLTGSSDGTLEWGTEEASW